VTSQLYDSLTTHRSLVTKHFVVVVIISLVTEHSLQQQSSVRSDQLS